jgi:4-amino-4-deoxy-L-arabinose transferase-like glycosyltransferase
MDGLVIALIVAYTLALIPGLTRWPPLVNDEGREANLFWVASGADPTAERMNAHRGFPTWGNGGIQGFTAGIIFRVAGVGVFQARLTSLIWAGGLLLFTYALGRYYWGRAAGLAAILLLAVSDAFLVSSHTLRPDVQVITLVLAALLLAEVAVSRAQPRWMLLSGYLLGLGFDVHPNSLALMPMVGAVLLVRQGWGFWRQPHLRFMVGGLALAAIQYLLFRFVPDPGGFIAGLRYWVGVDKAPPAGRAEGGGLANLIGNELARYWDYFGEEPLELALISVGLLAGLWWATRDDRGSRVILLGLLASFVFFVFAVSTKSKYYMLLTYPFYMLFVGRVIQMISMGWIARGRPHPSRPGTRGEGWGFGQPRAPWGGRDEENEFTGPLPAHGAGWEGVFYHLRSAAGRSALAATATFTLIVSLAAYYPLKVEDRAWENYIRARRYRAGQEYTQLTARLDDLAGPGARILAPPVYWIGLKDHPYTDIYVFERLARSMNMSPGQFLDETRPDIVITDAKIATDRRIERLLYNELDARSTYDLVVRHKNYGDVAIYRLNWN